MRKHLLFLLATLLMVQRSATSAQTPAQGAEPDRPSATIKEIMMLMVDPSADYIWESVGTEVSPAGIRERSPQNDKEWEELRKRTLTLIEATNLLAIPGRPVAKAGEKSKNPQVELEPAQIESLINKDRAGWVNLAQGLRDEAVKVLAAVEAKNVRQLVVAGGSLDQACENCHTNYWYPSVKP